MYVPTKQRIAMAKDKKKDKKEKTFTSEEIKQCPDINEVRKRNKYRSVDLNIEDVTKSCEDLAIDG